MKFISDLEEKKLLLNKTYYNDYLLKLELKNKKYFDEIMRSYNIVQTDDNYYIVINTAKPSIDRDLWHDDEQELPKKTEELFVNYNLQMHAGTYNRVLEDEKAQLFIFCPYRGVLNNKLVACSGFRKSDYISDSTFVRDLNKEESDFIKAIYSALLDDYVERLKRYYKRYNDKIFVRGYWVNR